jgi:site-specific recombinase XerD
MKTKLVKNPEDVKHLERMKQHMLASNLSKRTVKNYLWSLHRTLGYSGKTLKDIDSDDVIAWLVYQKEHQERSFSTMNITVCSLRYMFKHILKREDVIEGVPYPRKQNVLPEVLSGKELQALFAKCKNLKYRVIMKLIYGSGLRISEAVNLKITDIDSKNMQVRIRQGKGKQDRFSILSEKILDELRAYYRHYRPDIYLFNGQKKGIPIGRGIVQTNFRRAKEAAGIQKDVSVHNLRHSFATHMLICGVDIVRIQHYLGHSDIHTTMMYLKMVPQTGKQPVSPLDYLYK